MGYHHPLCTERKGTFLELELFRRTHNETLRSYPCSGYGPRRRFRLRQEDPGRQYADAHFFRLDNGTQDATGDVDDMSPEMRAAIQQITDGRVLFAFDKFDIQPQYKDMLTAKAELMKKYPSIRVRIEGNCDERGTQE